MSGFIIYHVHAQDIGRPSTWLPYVKKRLVRIYPAYWVVLAVYALILFMSPTKERFEQIPSVAMAAFLLLPHPLGPVLGPAWSLSHELLFYGLFGLLLLSRWAGRWVLAAWAVLTAVQQVSGVFGTSFWPDQFFFRVFNLHFFFGMAVAWLYSRHVQRVPGVCLALGLLLFFGMGLWESWGPGIPTEWKPAHMAYASGAALALYGVVTLEVQGRLGVPAALVALGAASYSLYLIHVIVIMVWQQLLLQMPWVMNSLPSATYLVTVALAVVAGLIFHRAVEVPLTRVVRRHVLKG